MGTDFLFVMNDKKVLEMGGSDGYPTSCYVLSDFEL